ncbi:MAG: hypothetical protein KDD44_01275 [Bdellovibrionales bacterium]|nr:hypothetical protein [Bdellovibrionales bacterium]
MQTDTPAFSRTIERYQRYLDIVAPAHAELGAVIELQNPRFRVAVFGSHALPDDSPYTNRVGEVATELARHDIDVLEGGGPSAMAAAAKAVWNARMNGSKAVVISVTLGFVDQELHDFQHLAFATQDFGARLALFTAYSCHSICMPGGFGTLLEGSWAMQIAQKAWVSKLALEAEIARRRGTGEELDELYVMSEMQAFTPNPWIRRGFVPQATFFDSEFWQGHRAQMQTFSAQGTIRPHDTELARYVDTTDAIVEHVLAQRDEWRARLRSYGIEPEN